MTAYVALARAEHVPGTGALPDEILKARSDACGFDDGLTFISRENPLYTGELGRAATKQRIEEKLAGFFWQSRGSPMSAAQRRGRAVTRNPFSDNKPSLVMAHCFDRKPVQPMFDEVHGVSSERLALGRRLIYVSYGNGIGRSRLKLPAVRHGTARNMNSVARMTALLAGME